MNNANIKYIEISFELDRSGLVWHPEIGDEVVDRRTMDRVAIFVDSQGLTPTELRDSFIWLPSVEQLVKQFEARHAIISHAGLNDESYTYDVIVKTQTRKIEVSGRTLRIGFGKGLRNLLIEDETDSALH